MSCTCKIELLFLWIVQAHGHSHIKTMPSLSVWRGSGGAEGEEVELPHGYLNLVI